MIGRYLCAAALVFGVFLGSALSAATGQDSGFSAVTRQRIQPVLIRNDHNVLLQLTVTADEPFGQVTLFSVELQNAPEIASLQFYLTGSEPGFSNEKPFGDRVSPDGKMAVFEGCYRLAKGQNHFWLSCRMKSDADLSKRIDATVIAVETSAGKIVPTDVTPGISKRIGVALRRHWDDAVHTYRIPALATSVKGTLLCAYDMRRRAGRDLQEDIDIGLLRSTDGGQHWGAQQVIMDMGSYGGKPQQENGCSDPGLIVDSATGKIFCFAVWTHGKPGTHQWRVGGSEPGHEIGKSSQFMMVTSSDDGVTWSKPQNMTRAWKDPSWLLYAPAPQQGIALRDGTLVMPTQGRDADDRRFSNLLISKDHGESWTVSPPASYGNNECQAVELSDGSVMLNCRSERPTKFRTVVVTKDLGQTWTPHVTSRKDIIEPNCNGSTYRFDYRRDGKAGSVLLFANPFSQTSRSNHSIRVSFDDGLTWPEKHRLLLDVGRGAGYPSLSRVDDQHVGIVYEGSQSHVVFEKISVDELLKHAP